VEQDDDAKKGHPALMSLPAGKGDRVRSLAAKLA